MPNTRSARRHMRKSERRRRRNVSIKSAVRTSVKKAEQAFNSGNSEQAEEALREALRRLDKAHQKGVFKENTVNRKKSRLAKKFNKIQAA